MSVNTIHITTPEVYHDVHVHWKDQHDRPQHTLVRVMRTDSKNQPHVQVTVNEREVARSYPK